MSPADARVQTRRRFQFELQIRADEVVSAAKFSLAIYAEFNREWRQQIA